jgi:cobyric acid synthase
MVRTLGACSKPRGPRDKRDEKDIVNYYEAFEMTKTGAPAIGVEEWNKQMKLEELMTANQNERESVPKEKILLAVIELKEISSILRQDYSSNSTAVEFIKISKDDDPNIRIRLFDHVTRAQRDEKLLAVQTFQKALEKTKSELIPK